MISPIFRIQDSESLFDYSQYRLGGVEQLGSKAGVPGQIKKRIRTIKKELEFVYLSRHSRQSKAKFPWQASERDEVDCCPQANSLQIKQNKCLPLGIWVIQATTSDRALQIRDVQIHFPQLRLKTRQSKHGEAPLLLFPFSGRSRCDHNGTDERQASEQCPRPGTQVTFMTGRYKANSDHEEGYEERCASQTSQQRNSPSRYQYQPLHLPPAFLGAILP